jgi:murein DD-endopeptidase MepM/ murein hydrolase activator NlpD
MSYTECVARISQLDGWIRGVDPSWASSGRSMFAASSEALVGASPFAGVMESLTGTSASGSTSTDPLSGSTVLFTSPLPGATLTQAFGPSNETLEPPATVGGIAYAHYHNGIDLAAPLGTPVLAAASGTVVAAGPQSDGAVVVKIRHDDGYVSLYAHLDPSLQVAVGQHVAAGQTIGNVGMTGMTTGPHLHFGLYTSDGTAVDPSPYLAAGKLPDPATLLGPSASDPTSMSQLSGSAVLARFDAASSRIPYAAQIRSAAVANGIDPALLAGLVYAESGFDPKSYSSCGA